MSDTAHQRRIDRTKEHRGTFEKNRRRVLMAENYCAICGKFVDKSLNQYDPMSAEIDHIVPIAKGGHPSAIDNLQLTHRICNQHKSDRLQGSASKAEPKTNPLAWSMNWFDYRM